MDVLNRVIKTASSVTPASSSSSPAADGVTAEQLRRQNQELQQQLRAQAAEKAVTEKELKRLKSTSDAKYVADLEAELDAYRKHATSLAAAAAATSAHGSKRGSKKAQRRESDSDDLFGSLTDDDDDDDEDGDRDENVAARDAQSPAAADANQRRKDDGGNSQQHQHGSDGQSIAGGSVIAGDASSSENAVQTALRLLSQDRIRIGGEKDDDEDHRQHAEEVNLLRAAMRDQDDAMQQLLKDLRDQESAVARVRAQASGDAQRAAELEKDKLQLRAEVAATTQRLNDVQHELGLVQQKCDRYQHEAAEKSDLLRKANALQLQHSVSAASAKRSTSTSVPVEVVVVDGSSSSLSSSTGAGTGFMNSDTSDMTPAEWVQHFAQSVWFRRKLNRTNLMVITFAVAALLLVFVSTSHVSDAMTEDMSKHCEEWISKKLHPRSDAAASASTSSSLITNP